MNRNTTRQPIMSHVTADVTINPEARYGSAGTGFVKTGGVPLGPRPPGFECAGVDGRDPLIALVHAARVGDQDSWHALVDRFLPLVTAIIARYRLGPSDADDVNQTVWLRLLEHLDQLRDPLALPGWLATIARNESLQVIRLRGRHKPVDPQSAAWERSAPEPEHDIELVRHERATALREAMLELSPQHRELLRLLLTDPPTSYEQISLVLRIPVGSIGPTRARILDKLRTHRAVQRLATSS